MTMKYRILYIILFSFCSLVIYPQLAAPAAGVVEGMSMERLERYEDFIEKEIKEKRLPGAVSFIMRNGQVVHNKAFGYSDLLNQTPMAVDQIFYIQSMTKLVVSTAMMMLYEEGHFLLSDPVSKYLPFFSDMKVSLDPEKGMEGGVKELDRPIVIADLFSHTAGLSHGLGNNALEQATYAALYGKEHMDLESRVKALVEMPMIGQPGKQWHYSAGPDVLALLIQHFTGTNADEFLKARLFEPLGMDDTGYNVLSANSDRVAKVHLVADEGIMTSPEQTPSSGNTVFGGTHGLFSTAKDYSTFLTMLLNNGSYNGHQLLGKKTVELMTKNRIGDLYWQDGRGFGLGMAVTTDVPSTGMLGSNGDYFWSGYFCTYFIVDPIENMTMVLMSQRFPYTDYYRTKMRQLVYQALVD